ncbi:MAG TPA: 3-oxoadipate enol-lactonase [Xanthobacteraceae bacterium]|nr:3-oxoadipate enol-lactonase [Xanthobacteraceae bacterium]
MQFARLDNVTIHYRLTGDPAVRPVLALANSLGTDFRIWDGVVERLADDYSILLYDMRGHGLSELGAVPLDIDGHARDLEALLGTLGISRAVMCGLSVGGLVAQALYRRRPELVSALVLCGTAPKIGTTETWNARIAAVEAGGLDGLVDPVMERWFTPAFRTPENAAYAGCRIMLARQSPAGYAATCAAIRDADLTGAALGIAVPTLCIVGDQDGSTPPDLVRAMADLIPGARFEVIAGAGHIPCVEQPAALAALIRDFLGTATESRTDD